MSTVPFTPKKDAERPDESTLTDRQRKVLGAIKKHLVEQGFAPSFREIGEAAGLKSPSSVKHQLQVLDDKGFIRMNANKGRAIEVVSFDDDEVSPGKVAQVIPFPSQSDSSGSIMASRDVPLVGRIAAGVPITAEQHVDDVMRLPERLTGVDFKVWADRLAVIMMLMVLAWCLAGLMMPARAQSDPGATPVVVYTVQPGDTLWGYAARITPDGGNVADTVDELVRLNNLDSVSLRAGQRLIVPDEV